MREGMQPRMAHDQTRAVMSATVECLNTPDRTALPAALQPSRAKVAYKLPSLAACCQAEQGQQAGRTGRRAG